MFVAVVGRCGSGVVRVVVCGGRDMGMAKRSRWAGLGLDALSLEAVFGDHVKVGKSADI